MAFIGLNGIVIHHRVLGNPEGHPLVFLNSLGSDFRIWEEVVPHFLDRFRVVLYDMRGHGLSDAPSAPYAMDDHANDLLALLDALGIKEAAIVGLSVGGMAAQHVAVRAPERVRALVLCGTAAKIGTPEMWAERVEAVQRAGIEPIADRILERWFKDTFRRMRAADYAGWRNMLVRTPPHGYVGTCASIRDADLTRDAPQIRAPTLCIVGEADGSTPPEIVQGTAELIPYARFEVMENAAHIVCVEQPAALAALVHRHFREAGLV